jgi:Flp pilus assembly pilin Flp
MDTIKRLITDERGLETIEYAIMTSLIVAGVITVIAAIGTWVNTTFTDLQTELGA